jgi:hypothetical protein
MDRNEIFMVRFHSPCGMYTNSHLIDGTVIQAKWQM